MLLAAMLFLGILSICRSFCTSQEKTPKIFLYIYLIRHAKPNRNPRQRDRPKLSTRSQKQTSHETARQRDYEPV